MNSLQLQCFLFTLIFIFIQSKKICDFSDGECMKRGANHIYKTLTAGIEGVVESSDPLYEEVIEGELADLKYKLTNVTFTGMMDCEVTRLLCKPKELMFEYFLRCPHLVLKSGYKTEGPFQSFQINGRGDATLRADDYIIMFKGSYDKFISEEDQTPRVVIKSFDIETEPKGKFTLELNNMYEGDKVQNNQALNFLNQNPLEMEKMFRRAIIDGLLKKFMRNQSDSLKTFHLDVLVPQEEN